MRAGFAVNVHHLELFYYVAQHRGIAQAVRQMPYGIQQPAVSTQMRQLEQDVGARLFERSPFRLTKPGEELFEFIRPFFANLDAVAARVGKSTAPTLRVGAAEVMLRDYFPAVLQQLRADQPSLQFSLRSGFTSELHAALRERALDLIIVPHTGRVAPGLRCLRLLRLQLALLVPQSSPLRRADELWQQPRIDTPLISLPDHEVISRIFQRGLKRRWVEWPCALEASSIDLVGEYVAHGQGLGLVVNVAESAMPPGVRLLPLDGFDPVEIAVQWIGKPTPMVQLFLDHAQRFVAQRWPRTKTVVETTIDGRRRDATRAVPAGAD